MVVLVVGIVAAVALAPDPPEDWGVEWQPPAEMTVDHVDVDAENETLTVTLRLWDERTSVTEWGGALDVRIADEDGYEVYHGARRIKADDFKSTLLGDIVDTRYVLRVPFWELDHVTPRMIERPRTDVSVLATFTTGGRTLTATQLWWLEPASVVVTHIDVDEDYGAVFIDLLLLDARGWSTRWTGDLGIAIVDSLGVEMYNECIRIEAGEFNLFAFGRSGWAWYVTWVEFDDILPSGDRLDAADGNGSGRQMTVSAWFVAEGRQVRQTQGDDAEQRASARIPDALLLDNAPPTARLESDELGLADHQLLFDASGTTDDLGTAGLTYEWSWGDGSLLEATEVPFANHTFARAGSYEVELVVTDVEGASSRTTVTVDVLQDPRVDLDLLDREPGERVRDSYVVVVLKDRLAATVGDRFDRVR